MAVEAKYCVPLVIGLALAVGVIALIATSLKRLDSYEVGLAYNTISKSLADEPKGEGLHNGPPGFTFIIFPSVYKTISFTDLKCLNKDGVEITLDVAYQYLAKAAHLKEIVSLFKDHVGYEKVLKNTGGAVLHEACSQFNTSQFQAERAAFQETVRRLMKVRYTDLYANIADMQVNNIDRPREYESAVRSKEAARENINVAENERPRMLTEARTKKREAETQATIIIDKALSDSRIKETKATAEAQAILNQYEVEADTYEKLKSSGTGLNLDEKGFISYIGVRTIASAKNPVYIGMKGPAKTSYTSP